MSRPTIRAVIPGPRWLALLLVALWGALVQSQVPTAAVNAVVRVSGTVDGAPFHGSGFVIALDRGVATILTASHVIEGALRLEVTFAADPMRSFAVSKVVNIEPQNQNGLAVFVVQGDVPGGVRPLQLAEGASGLSPGDSAFLIGYPQNATGTAPRTLTRSFSRRDGSRYEFDGGVEGGISGGPVVAGDRAVGVITETVERYSYAVPFTIVREFLLGSGVSLPSEAAAASIAVSAAGSGPVASRRAGDVFRDCADCPELVVIPAGTFTMGSPASEEERDADEGPQHRVTVASFALGKLEVTRAQFERYVTETGAKGAGGCYVWTGTAWEMDAARSWQAPGWRQTAAEPVVCVSWEDAAGYVTWLAGKTKQGYRLPSEAEWEYAGRAGTTTRRVWGDGAHEACGYANVADATANKTFSGWTVHGCDDGHVYTAPTGSFRPNKFGLHDMLGNVYEWTQDCWQDDYTGAPATGEAWATGTCASRVLRGGAWLEEPRFVRSANRLRSSPANRNPLNGFRVARTLP